MNQTGEKTSNNEESESNSENDSDEEIYEPLGPNHTREQEYENRRMFTFRKKLQELGNERRLQILLKYTKCKEAECKCVGWRKYTSRHGLVPWHKERLTEYMNKDTGVMDLSPNASSKPENESLSPCKRCGHRFSSHTPLEMWTVKVADELLRGAIDMHVLFLNAKEAVDPTVKRINNFVYKMIRYSLANALSHVAFITHGVIPYAMRPLRKLGETVIADGILRFIELRNANAPLYVRNLNFDLGTSYLTFVNTTIYETPQERTASIGRSDPVYVKEFERWLLYCHIPVLCGSLPYGYATRIMGLLFLYHQYERFKSRIANFITDPYGRQLMKFSQEFFQKMVDGDKYIWTGVEKDAAVRATHPRIAEEILRNSQRPMGDAHISWYRRRTF